MREFIVIVNTDCHVNMGNVPRNNRNIDTAKDTAKLALEMADTVENASIKMSTGYFFKCDKCSRRIEEQIKFCPQCGDPTEKEKPEWTKGKIIATLLSNKDYSENLTEILDRYFDQFPDRLAEWAEFFKGE